MLCYVTLIYTYVINQPINPLVVYIIRLISSTKRNKGWLARRSAAFRTIDFEKNRHTEMNPLVRLRYHAMQCTKNTIRPKRSFRYHSTDALMHLVALPWRVITRL